MGQEQDNGMGRRVVQVCLIDWFRRAFTRWKMAFFLYEIRQRMVRIESGEERGGDVLFIYLSRLLRFFRCVEAVILIRMCHAPSTRCERVSYGPLITMWKMRYERRFALNRIAQHARGGRYGFVRYHFFVSACRAVLLLRGACLLCVVYSEFHVTSISYPIFVRRLSTRLVFSFRYVHTRMITLHLRGIDKRVNEDR